MENSPNRVVLMVGGAVAVVVVLVGGWWFAAPFLQADEPVARSAPAQPARQPQQRQGRQGRSKPQMGAGPAVYAEEGGAARAAAAKDPAAKAEARSARAAAFNAKLDEYAAEKGWDAQTTEDVRTVVLSTVDGVRESLGEARQSKSREAARASLQQLRVEQQEALVGLLGAEGSREFATAMNLAQYFPRANGGGRAKAGGAAGGPRRSKTQ
jgi:hypothetical protein